MRSRLSPRSWYLALLLIIVGTSVASGQGIKRPTIPLRKAVDELRQLREAYAEAYNKKDTTTVAGMYAPDAIVINADGSVLVGADAIRKSMASDAPQWRQIAITSDTVRVVGHTAWDIGTTRTTGSGGEERVSHYLAVLRRGLKYWKVNSLAMVPETSAADSATRR